MENYADIRLWCTIANLYFMNYYSALYVDY